MKNFRQQIHNSLKYYKFYNLNFAYKFSSLPFYIGKFHIPQSRIFWFSSDEKFSSWCCSNTENILYAPPDTFIVVLFFQNIVFKFGAISATDDFVRAFDTMAERRRHKTRCEHKNWNIVRGKKYKYTHTRHPKVLQIFYLSLVVFLFTVQSNIVNGWTQIMDPSSKVQRDSTSGDYCSIRWMILLCEFYEFRNGHIVLI